MQDPIGIDSDYEFPDYSLSSDLVQDCGLRNEPQLVFGSIMIALVVIGLVGNSLVFFTILVLHEYKKSVTNWYILQLTLADTLFLLMLPFTAHSEVVGTWEFNLSLCKFKEAVIFINYYASIYFLVVMSCDRYLAVTKAFDSRKWLVSLRSPTASYIISAVGWIVSALLCVQLYRYSRITACNTCEYIFPVATPQLPTVQPLTQMETQEAIERAENETGVFPPGFDFLADYFSNSIGLTDPEIRLVLECISSSNTSTIPGCISNVTESEIETQPGPEPVFLCKIVDSRELHVWIYGNFAGAFVLPFVLICYFYGMIMRKVQSASVVESNGRQRSYRRRVTMIVFALVSLFAISWLPWYVEKLVKIQGIDLSRETCTQLTNAVRGIAFMNSAFNPYFYSFLGFHFRDRLKQAGSRVRLVMSMRSKSYRTSSMRRRNHYNSSSNSAGVRLNQNGYPASKSSMRNNNMDMGGMTKVGAKTERTEV